MIRQPNPITVSYRDEKPFTSIHPRYITLNEAIKIRKWIDRVIEYKMQQKGGS